MALNERGTVKLAIKELQEALKLEDNNDKINFANIWARDVPAIVSDMVVALAGEPDVYP